MLLRLVMSNYNVPTMVYMAIIMVFAITLSFALHEFMHAAVAVWLGDDTPKLMGRLTLNPLAHLDPWGTILLLLAGFGWGKPVMYNPNRLHRFKSRRLMNIMVHLAGVTGNFIIALIANIFALLFMGLATRFGNLETVFHALYDLFDQTRDFSLMLLAFNLLPIPPLDGFHVLEELLPLKLRYSNGYRKFQQITPYIIFAFFLSSYIPGIPRLSGIVSLVQVPFVYLINLITTPFYLLLQMVGLF